MPGINFRSKYEKLAIVAHVLQNAQNLVILRCCAEDGYEMYKDLQRTCTATVLLILMTLLSPFRCRRGLLKLLNCFFLTDTEVLSHLPKLR